MAQIASVLVVVASLWSAQGARADSWASPKLKTVSSPSGAYTVTMKPGGNNSSPTLTLQKGSKRVYERRAINSTAPVNVLVGDGGHVVTFDDYHDAGYDHALVVYAPDGKLVIDRRLEEILTSDELANVDMSVSSRWWIDGDPKIDRGFAVARTRSKELRFRLVDGVQYRNGKPFHVPSDEERLIGFATGSRIYASSAFELHETSGDLSGVRCNVTTTAADCAPFGKTHHVASKRTLVAGAYQTALKSILPLVRLANVERGASLPVAHWYLYLTFEEANYNYSYKILLPRKSPQPVLVNSMLALRRLTPLK